MTAVASSGSASLLPQLWHGLAWSIRSGSQGGGISRPRLLWRTLVASITQPKAMRRWMAVAFELHSRGVIQDLPGEYLRAVRPYVHRRTDVNTRVVQLIDHIDWLETAFQPGAFEQLATGRPLVLAELPAPRGCQYMRLQLQRAAAQSPEGELLLTLTLQRTTDVQHKPQPVDAAVLCFSRFRVNGMACLAIGGVRGQRHPVLRLSPAEISLALSGWKPAVLMVQVAQELARHWGLRLIALDPDSHPLQSWVYQWKQRHRDAALRIYRSYDALWKHFDAKPGPLGWMILPLSSDEQLAATALSPEMRARQTQRADYWLRIRNLLRLQLRHRLRAGRETTLSRVTEGMEPDMQTPQNVFDGSPNREPGRLLETGPDSLL